MSFPGICLFLLLGGLILPQNPPSQTAAPWLGNWKLNPQHSTNSGAVRYKRVTTRIELWEGGLKVIYEMVGLRGGVTHMEWTGKLDGKDYAVQGLDYVMTNAYTPIDDHSYRITVKVDGKLAATTTVTIAPDGKTLTTVTREKNAQGDDAANTAVYERQ